MGANRLLRWNVTLGIGVAALLSTVLYAQQAGRPPERERPLESLRFRYMGPASAGRIAAIAGIPGKTS